MPGIVYYEFAVLWIDHQREMRENTAEGEINEEQWQAGGKKPAPSGSSWLYSNSSTQSFATSYKSFALRSFKKLILHLQLVTVLQKSTAIPFMKLNKKVSPVTHLSEYVHTEYDKLKSTYIIFCNLYWAVAEVFVHYM